MPRRLQALATRTPMAPRPITPSFLPFNSVPANCFLPFSTSLSTAGSVFTDCTQFTPPTISRAARNIPASTASLTPLALAPGVLKTTMPCSAHLSSGILFTPAPALATARRPSGRSISCMAALLTIATCASAKLSTFS